LFTLKRVVVAKAAVDEPILKMTWLGLRVAGVAKIERVAVGVVVPIPTLLANKVPVV
jgi:hypothetical protein